MSKPFKYYYSHEGPVMYDKKMNPMFVGGIWRGEDWVEKPRIKKYREWFCNSTLGHIGNPCVFCGYESK